MSDTITLRLSTENVQALQRGVHCDVTFMRLALGEDGVYELYLEFVGEWPLPDSSVKPAVPLAD